MNLERETKQKSEDIEKLSLSLQMKEKEYLQMLNEKKKRKAEVAIKT